MSKPIPPRRGASGPASVPAALRQYKLRTDATPARRRPLMQPDSRHRQGVVGADIGWGPATNLNFDLELLVQTTTQARPAAYVGAHPWVPDSSRLLRHLRIP